MESTKLLIIMKHFTTKEEIFKYIQNNPTFISGFISGEGCFTGYMGIDIDLTWGLQWGCEFSVVQNSGDLILLEAISMFFNNVGKVYDRKSGTHVYLVRNTHSLEKVILPFFLKYPLVGSKSYEYAKFNNLIHLVLSKRHIGRDLSNRDIFIDMCYICKDLNKKYGSLTKLARLEIILDGLNNFKFF